MSRFESFEKESRISHVLVYLLLYENKLYLWVVDRFWANTHTCFSVTPQTYLSRCLTKIHNVGKRLYSLKVRAGVPCPAQLLIQACGRLLWGVYCCWTVDFFVRGLRMDFPRQSNGCDFMHVVKVLLSASLCSANRELTAASVSLEMESANTSKRPAFEHNAEVPQSPFKNSELPCLKRHQCTEEVNFTESWIIINYAKGSFSALVVAYFSCGHILTSISADTPVTGR